MHEMLLYSGEFFYNCFGKPRDVYTAENIVTAAEFGEEGGLTLPHSYKIELTLEQNTTLMIDWVMNFQEFHLNEPVDSSVFSILQ